MFLKNIYVEIQKNLIIFKYSKNSKLAGGTGYEKCGICDDFFRAKSARLHLN